MFLSDSLPKTPGGKPVPSFLPGRGDVLLQRYKSTPQSRGLQEVFWALWYYLRVIEPQDHQNSYIDDDLAKAYSVLEFPGCYYLAYTGLSQALERYSGGNNVLDFGCGTGRSTRFLRNKGYDVTGIDVSAQMIAHAKNLDPSGKYTLVEEGDFSALGGQKFDVVTSVFTFDNIAGVEQRISLFRDIGSLLSEQGIAILIDANSAIYTSDTTSFYTNYPENFKAQSGDPVKVAVKDIEDSRPVIDILWHEQDYYDQFAEAGLEVLETLRPLGMQDDPYEWITEHEVPPFFIFVVRSST